MVRFVLALSVLILAACDDAPPADLGDGTAIDELSAVDGDEALPEGHPAIDGSLSGAPVPALHAGTVKETMTSGGYTYVLLETDHETIWVAGPATEVAAGDPLTVPTGGMMKDFASPTLGRTFDEILFVEALHTGEISAEAKACHDPEALEEVADFATAEGGVAIAEVHERAAELDGQTISVRGQVIKSSHGIMGTNWIHIQDATGSVAGNAFDLTVTTANSEIAVGDVVLVNGALATDRDFGAGYQYAVIVEDATVTVEGTATVD